LGFAAEQLDVYLGVTNGWSGVTMGWATRVANQNNFRLRLFGLHNINDNVTGAFLVTANATLATLKISFQGFNYVVGDLRINATVWNYLLNEQVGVTITSKKFPNGTIGGYLLSRPHLGVSVLSSSYVVPAQNVSSAPDVGLGFSYFYNPATLAPNTTDLLTLSNYVANSFYFYSRVIFQVPNATACGFFGPANYTSTGPLLSPLITYTTFATSSAGVFVKPQFFTQEFLETYFQVASAKHPKGDIRGQIANVARATHRHVPYSVNQIYGATQAPNGYATLRHSNQENFNNHAGSYITLQTTQQSTGQWLYQGVFYFRSGARKQNQQTIRGLRMEVNLRQVGAQPGTSWTFEVFNARNNTWMTAGVLTSTARTWQYAAIELDLGSLAWGLPSSRGYVLMRISAQSSTQQNLLLDLFAMRFYIPSVAMNQAIKSVIKVLPQLPTQ